MADKTQRQPLRVPAGWKGQDAAFVIQLERVLDDVYRNITQLKDENKSLDERVTALEDE